MSALANKRIAIVGAGSGIGKAIGGSITLFSGGLSRRPGINCSGLGAVNGAVESLCYGLALELGQGQLCLTRYDPV